MFAVVTPRRARRIEWLIKHREQLEDMASVGEKAREKESPPTERVPLVVVSGQGESPFRPQHQARIDQARAARGRP